METCVFCKIAQGEIPIQPVYEDADVIAFNDLSPQAPAHVLVIPKDHYEHLGDGVPTEIVASLFCAVPEVARRAGIDKSGYRVIVNAGSDANQTVSHLHVHVLGGAPMRHEMVTFEGGHHG